MCMYMYIYIYTYTYTDICTPYSSAWEPSMSSEALYQELPSLQAALAAKTELHEFMQLLAAGLKRYGTIMAP